MTHPLHEDNLRRFSTERLIDELRRRGHLPKPPLPEWDSNSICRFHGGDGMPENCPRCKEGSK